MDVINDYNLIYNCKIEGKNLKQILCKWTFNVHMTCTYTHMVKSR